MKSRLLGNGIDMGLIQPLPPPLPHTQVGGGGLLTLISMKPNVLHFEKMIPSSKCDVKL